MRFMRRALVALVGLSVALGTTLGTTSPASADPVPGADELENFLNSEAGWVTDTLYQGLCVALVLCPGVTNEYTDTGGVDGADDGYIRTGFASLLVTLAGTSSGVWESPEFTYDGSNGTVPQAVEFGMSVRPALGALLGLDLLNTSTYRVDLVDTDSDAVISLIEPTGLTPSSTWTEVPSVDIDPEQLTVGDTYAVRITTAYNSVLALLANGEVGYDDVWMTVTGKNGGSGIISVPQLTKIVKTIVLPGSAKVVKRTVTMRLKCPASAAPKSCKTTTLLKAKGKKSPAATKVKKATIKPGTAKTITMKVKPKYAKKFTKAKKAIAKITVKVGSVKSTVHKKVKLKKRKK